MTSISSSLSGQRNLVAHTERGWHDHRVSKAKKQDIATAKWSDATSAKIHAALSQKPMEFDTHMSERMFAHVIGNGLLADSELEGNVFADSMSYAADELERAHEGEYGLDLPDNELEELQTMQEELEEAKERMLQLYALSTLSDSAQPESCARLARSFLKEAQTLKPGERMLIPGGWSSKVQGHAMLYELEKTSDGRILFHLFNSGDGLQYHPQREQDGQIKCLCHLTWDLGKGSQALSTFERVFTDLVHLRTNGNVYPPHTSVDQLYKCILPKFNALGARSIEASACDPCWMSEQKSGVCTWQSIMTWKKSHMKAQTYRRLKLCAKVRAFRQFAIQYPEKLETESKIKSIAAKALAKTARQLEQEGLDKELIAIDNLKPTEEMRQQNLSRKLTTITSQDHPWARFIDALIHRHSYKEASSHTKLLSNVIAFKDSSISWLESMWKHLVQLMALSNKEESRREELDKSEKKQREQAELINKK